MTKIPEVLPGVHFQGLSKDQYQVMLDARQTLWDGGAISAEKEVTRSDAAAEKQQAEVGLYALRDRVNQLYFGILLSTAQLEQNALLGRQLERNRAQVAAWIRSGVATPADLDAVNVERLQARQDSIQYAETRAAYLRVLALFIGRPAVAADELQKPAPVVAAGRDIRRPELQLYDLQLAGIGSRLRQLETGKRPSLSLFLQAAYGKPGLNLLENKFKPYAVGGISLSWNLSRFYTLKNDRQLLALRREGIASDRETFLLGARMDVAGAEGEAGKWQRMMASDDELIRLRGNIRQAAEQKAARGTMTVTDMLREVTAEAQARQGKVMHEIRYLMAIYDQKYIMNQP